ncbi:MAG: sulfite exporter TauE/SafE family protein [Gemmatimonadetes bacterium]|nr:sulfite exporter TauE/SafE family protein [Gemmatimonadota bacterium]
MDAGPLMLAGLAAFAGGAINSIAGGGTLITFPAIVALGVSPLVANVTNTMALWPGAVSGLWAYRRQLVGMRAWLWRSSGPSLLGGLAGGWLLLATGERRFAAIVPYLVLGATALFALQGPIRAWLGRHGAEPDVSTGTFLVIQFAVGVYGGYFGAGIGILMLAALGLVGLTDIHRMNAVKVWGALLINVVAAALFAARGVIDWPLAGAMATGALLGGYAGSRLAQRIGQRAVRGAVIVIGLLAFAWLLLRD